MQGVKTPCLRILRICALHILQKASRKKFATEAGFLLQMLINESEK